MDRPVRWGVLSTALISMKLLGGAAQSDAVEVLATASRSRDKAVRHAERWGIPRAYGSYEELLADPDVEAVYVPLPNGLHHTWTMRALEAGKHVLCEKPYSRRPAEVREAFDLAQERGLVLSEAFMYRYNPQIRRLADLVRGGAIGELRQIVSSFSWPTDAPGDVRLEPALDGGSLLDVGVYCVSAARLLAGEPRLVSGHAVHGPSGVDIGFAGTLVFAGDVLATFDCGFHLPDRSHLEVVGTTAGLVVHDPWHCFEPGIRLQPRDGRARAIDVPRADSYRLELEEFGKAVRGRPHTLLGRDDAWGQAATVEALYGAAASGSATAPAL
jgi:xylose dehydrogenase (NAD/NADP)